jgi:murein DD-endopeptidase MepM/ murein hydrolase activator NlpD
MPWLLALLWLAGCASMGFDPRTSVEEILRRHPHVREPQSVPKFLNPVAGTTGVLSPFGQRNDRPHHGVDLKANWGTRIQASAPGTVIYAGNGIDGYGDTIILRHESGYYSLYAHLSEILVATGEEVLPGTAIGRTGDTGNASGPHLHFEIRKGLSPLDPSGLVSFKPR